MSMIIVSDIQGKTKVKYFSRFNFHQHFNVKYYKPWNISIAYIMFWHRINDIFRVGGAHENYIVYPMSNMM